ncbi:MAG TPA: mechanosensitive ion channel domain-containing protein [Candidatus Cybelea sp.]|nr:mechanosensitive ion channel domain-containing protein [Candidatus Cybelea sp.]
MNLRSFAILAALLALLVAPTRADAQVGLPQVNLAAAEANASSAPPNPEDLSRLVATLEDPVARARLIADLKALIEAQKRTEEAAPTAEFGERLLHSVSAALEQASGFLDSAAEALGDPARVVRWVSGEMERPERRAFWADVLIKLGVALGSGIAAGLAAGWLVSGAARRLEQRAAAEWWRRLLPLFARSLLDMVPIVAFVAVAYFAVAASAPSDRVRLVVLAAIDAAVTARVLVALARLALSPFGPALRLFRLNDETAAYIYVWLRRLVLVGAYGYFALQAALALGLPHAVFDALNKLYGLMLITLLAIFALQNRDAVARVIRGRVAHTDEAPDPLHRLRRQFADIWHVLALFYLAAIYVIWALQVPNGFAFVMRSSVFTLAILGLARLAIGLSRRGWDWLLAVNSELLARNPLVEIRANRYLPYVKRGVILIIQLAALFSILTAWHIDVGQVAQGVGRELLGRFARVVLVLAVAIAVWEALSLAITLYLDRRDESGRHLLRSARARTFLPLLRNVLLVVIVLFAGLSVLSDLGVDITPFLAGAGVLGLAIGFGAQTLVKDVITGAFILFEGTVNIGDMARINNLLGEVEGMTIRTIRLRDPAGIAHTIPFGSIDTVSNLSKDYSYYPLDIGVAYGENTDRVVDVLKHAFTELQGDAQVGRYILGELEVQGVDRFEASAVYIRARIKTRPGRHLPVGRAFNRLMKQAFDREGIEMPFPQQTVWFGRGKDGDPPVLRIRTEPDPE